MGGRNGGEEERVVSLLSADTISLFQGNCIRASWLTSQCFKAAKTKQKHSLIPAVFVQ